MRVLFDSSVLVPALVEAHENHGLALPALQEAARGEVKGFATTHALAETWAVASSLPLLPRLTGSEVLESLREGLRGVIEIVPLTVEDYFAAMESVSRAGWCSGAVYDALHLQAARKVRADLVLTWNLVDFRRVAPDLRDRIRTPGRA